ncbi:MAG: NADPH-dependent F420 reductase [Candidatus Methanoperedens sp.]|nr:NADPH-dependent F420 reductase [Candidatus Methanoperedens sp.]MCE8424981.1 NADPH-dependent F420 reductase [Candidatus Methanoperedens sp.]MCE8427415.1 NADPH-dependent F420 reductase [Candidatus Methanoperedens sp.]
MKIAILGGTGSIGEGFALRWADKHDIKICSREVYKAVKAVDEYKKMLSEKRLYCCGMGGCMNEAGIRDADVVVLSVPYDGVKALLKNLLPYFNEQIVISLVVPMKKNDWYEYTPPKQGSAALEIQEILPKSVKVVSAYHNVSAKKLARLELRLDYDVVVCGDDADAKGTVMKLTKDIKTLHPLDGGGLASSYMIESLTPFLLNLAIRNGFSDLGVKFV